MFGDRTTEHAEIEKNVSHWVHSYFSDVEADVPETVEHAKCGPKAIRNRVRSKSAASSLMLEHAQNFFKSPPATPVRADEKSLFPGLISEPPGVSEKKWTEAACEFPSVVLLDCGRGILLRMLAALRVLLAGFVSAHKLLSMSLRSIHRATRVLASNLHVAFTTIRQFVSAGGRSIRLGIRLLGNLPSTRSSFPFLADTRMQLAIVLFSVLVIMSTVLISMPRITTHGSSKASTETATDKGQDTKAAALPIQAESGSHYRVTDSSVGHALANLSRFEIAPLERQATYGDADAALLVAMAYETGYELTQSCVKASQWVKVSAEGGNPAAEFNLGLRYLVGDGVSVNEAEGLKWLGKAAAHNYSEAEHLLAHDRLSSLPLDAKKEGHEEKE